MARTNPCRDHVFVVLATWNGAAYVAQQIESIIGQTESNWTLLIRDDESDDETLDIVGGFCNRESRIELLSDTLGRCGPARNFGVLMQAALDRGADYVFSPIRTTYGIRTRSRSNSASCDRRNEIQTSRHQRWCTQIWL